MGKRSAVIESAIIFVDEIKTGTTFTVQNAGFGTQSETMTAVSDIQADALDSNGGFKVLVTSNDQGEEFWRLIGANDTIRVN